MLIVRPACMALATIKFPLHITMATFFSLLLFSSNGEDWEVMSI